MQQQKAKDESDDDVVFIQYTKKRTLPNTMIAEPNSSKSALNQLNSPKLNSQNNSNKKPKLKSSPFINNLKTFEYNPSVSNVPSKSMNSSKSDKAKSSFAKTLLKKQNEEQVSFDELCNQLRKPLSDEQKTVFEKVVHQTENVFFTGSAGTGKSFLLRCIIKALRKKHGRDAVAITASTGIAACNISGSTLHSFAGVGLAKATVDKLLPMIYRNQKTKTRWFNTKVLVIDEISMVDLEFFEKLEKIACALKNLNPFGGIQLVICGDFMQLPPVSKTNGETKFCFESSKWNECVPHTVVLKKVFRQKDAKFVSILNDMRVGIISKESETILRGLSREIQYKDGIEATCLFSLRTQVAKSNSIKLGSLPGATKIFTAIDSSSQEMDIKKINDNTIAPDLLELKEGAQVMLIKNLSRDLVNGSLGKVIKLDEDTGYPLVRFQTEEGRVDRLIERESFEIEVPGREHPLVRTQVPLILSYAMSIHKSQGQTLERVKVDLGGVFEKGQAYVALSRAKTMDKLQVLNFDPKRVAPHPKVIEYHARIEKC